MGMLGGIYGVHEEEIPRLQDDPEALEDFLEDHEDVCSLDKAWHGIHFLLTGSAWDGDPPLNFLLHGGIPLDESEDPPCYLDPYEVVDVHLALEGITAAKLGKRFDPREFVVAGIYPPIWDRAGEESMNLKYLTDAFESMKEHLAGLVEAKKGAIVWIR